MGRLVRLHCHGFSPSIRTVRAVFFWLLRGVILMRMQVVPIPGTRAVSRLEENARSIDIRLSAEDIAAIRKRVEEADIVGGARSTAIPHGDCIKLADWNN